MQPYPPTTRFKTRHARPPPESKEKPVSPKALQAPALEASLAKPRGSGRPMWQFGRDPRAQLALFLSGLLRSDGRRALSPRATFSSSPSWSTRLPPALAARTACRRAPSALVSSLARCRILLSSCWTRLFSQGSKCGAFSASPTKKKTEFFIIRIRDLWGGRLGNRGVSRREIYCSCRKGPLIIFFPQRSYFFLPQFFSFFSNKLALGGQRAPGRARQEKPGTPASGAWHSREALAQGSRIERRIERAIESQSKGARTCTRRPRDWLAACSARNLSRERRPLPL